MWTLLLSSALAGDTTLGGLVRPEVWYDPVKDFELEDSVEVHTWSRAWAHGEMKNHDQWFLEARLQHHVLIGEDTEAWWELGLGESGWDGKLGGAFRLRAGTLVERWGKLDLLPVADILNPRDARSGAMMNSDFTRIPVPMAVVAIEGGAVRAETVLVPFATSDRLWTRETDWSYLRQGMTDDLLGEVGTWEGGQSSVIKGSLQATRAALDEMSTNYRRNLDYTFTSDNLPEALIGNGEIAERIEFTGRNADLGLFGGYLRSRQPDARLEPFLQEIMREERAPEDAGEVTEFQNASAGGPLIVEFPRTAVAGLDGSALVGPLQFRGDGLFRSAQVVRTFYGNTGVIPSLAAGLGADWFQSSHLQITVEAKYSHLFEPPDELMFAKEDQFQVAGGVRVVTARDALTLQLGGLYDVSFSEALVRPSVSWKATDHVAVDLMGVVLVGSTAAPSDVTPQNAGSWEGDESFTYEGGVLSYFQQNDSIGLAVQLTP